MCQSKQKKTLPFIFHTEKYIEISLYTDLIVEEFARGSQEDKIQSQETNSNWLVKTIDNQNDNDC